ncbi:hypothetical protein NQ317_017176 [Molorchus minor]|uniref:Dynein heavy chain hydrolytic ATP-binding dynein motor region domain-containing protein n=1 Tax=Molorchus minor TaxID=1323400 RepID=A0ABQ9IX06_9CUCU|nr:hypothetical protein NQ317_017176 [Molorchus minor]
MPVDKNCRTIWKVLFRTVAMMVPDYALIGEISLYSYGFAGEAKTLYLNCDIKRHPLDEGRSMMKAVSSVLLQGFFPEEYQAIDEQIVAPKGGLV